MLIEPLRDYIEKFELLNKTDTLLLAVSGGKDSVLMATLFKEAGITFSIAHCNFQLREEESTRDSEFVAQLADTLEVPIHIRTFDTSQFAEDQQLSTQMAARQLRYDWFEELAQKHGYTKIALAHHKNDSIETVLLNLTRGTGISGLHGILPKNGKFIRPLLFLTAEEIASYVSNKNISYVEDSSNLTTKYARNKIRHQVIPILKQLNPNLENTFAQNIEKFQETEIVLKQVVEGLRKTICKQENDFCYINIDALKGLQPKQLLTYELLGPYNFNYSTVQQVLENLDNTSGTSFYSSSHRLTISRTEIILSPLAYSQPQLLSWHEGIQSVNIFNGSLKLTIADSLPWQFDPSMAYVQYEDLQFPLTVRKWEQGDQFKPFGMNNFKKLSDFFIDNKMPIPEKDITPIIINGNSEIIWIAGMRQDNRYKVSETTKKVAIFEWINNEPR